MIDVQGLTKRFGHHVAVDDVTFRCAPGTVTGLLGPNGAGKSTTLRVLVGLAAASAGSATVLGRPYRRLENPGRHVGVLLDASAHHAGRSGRETLAIAAQLLGVDRARVDGMLDEVGLAGPAARQRVGTYSLGMRQRLGIAVALLGDPTVLVLDEPANGLDPEGIAWMRVLLRRFADAGGTVLLSSHLLHEVEAIADRLVVIVDGRVVAEGDIDDLLRRRGIVARAADGAALAAALEAAGLTATADGDGAQVVDAEAETVARAAASAGVVLVELRPTERAALEDLFLSLVKTPTEDRS